MVESSWGCLLWTWFCVGNKVWDTHGERGGVLGLGVSGALSFVLSDSGNGEVCWMSNNIHRVLPRSVYKLLRAESANTPDDDQQLPRSGLLTICTGRASRVCGKLALIRICPNQSP